jgi:GR25 family glycosyltransferase involved in LPS biosynthesis
MSWMLPITWILHCNGETIRNVFNDWSDKFLYSLSSLPSSSLPASSLSSSQQQQQQQKSENKRKNITLLIVETCAKAMRQMEIRNIDSYRSIVSSPTTTMVTPISHFVVPRLIESIMSMHKNTNKNKESIIDLTCLSTLLSICHELADGESAIRLIQWRILSSSSSSSSLPLNDDDNSDSDDEISSNHRHNRHHQQLASSDSSNDVLWCMNYWSSFPMVRVINLKRRKDRMASFMSQAMHSGLWAIRGVIPPDRWQAIDDDDDDNNNNAGTESCNSNADTSTNTLTSYIGTYAIDGSQDSPAEVERNLMSWVESEGSPNNNNGSAKKRVLDSLVLPRWRPNNLRAFDVHASDDPSWMVSLSPSEKACALSHIATWNGVASSNTTCINFTFSGFARGDPMHTPLNHNNDDDGIPRSNRMPPTPVALVLEDDAICVDRFKDRLEEVLQELPRDFHYCAIGYAKPKEAPLVDIPGCEHIKLPTMTWYLTGYLLSKAGARYLLNHLPVVGPVDTWMGRKMILTSNWENDYGHRIGVGNAPSKEATSNNYAQPPTISRKEIRECVQFRAYCASVPLCDQKVRTTTATGASAKENYNKPLQNWRFRDSDIVYSGNTGGGGNSTNRSNYKKKL